MFRKILARLGYKVEYQDERGIFNNRYDSTDFAMERPIHNGMPIAYPWAKMKITKL